jgi:hypothetical protein
LSEQKKKKEKKTKRKKKKTKRKAADGREKHSLCSETLTCSGNPKTCRERGKKGGIPNMKIKN